LDLLVIPDGNRRWARHQGKSFDYGFRQLPVKIAMLTDILRKNGIFRLYFWCCSPDNLLRPPEQVDSFLGHYADLLDYINEPDLVRIHIKGNIGKLPDDYADRFLEMKGRTVQNESAVFDLYLFLAYSTVDDVSRAMKKTGYPGMSSVLQEMDEPDNIDIILRTGGNHRLSGFYPLKSPSAEIVVVPEFFPELKPGRITELFKIHNKREVRNGV
jgi:undecaprenyl diphosphate synthase